MYAVSVREDGEFGFTKERFNMENERLRYDEDSRVICSSSVVVNAKIGSEWVMNSHAHYDVAYYLIYTASFNHKLIMSLNATMLT
jgi:hypothetical protein